MIFMGNTPWADLVWAITGPRNSWTIERVLQTATLELDQAFFQITNGWSRGYIGPTQKYLTLTKLYTSSLVVQSSE